jgi:hydroxymethylpyrimidine pyrophosphatase-like HAD family hydrolase
MNRFGFEADAYMAFGDSLNDIDMLKHARLSVRMENGDPHLDQYTDDVAPACSQGGIYHYLKEHGWIEHENRHHTD